MKDIWTSVTGWEGHHEERYMRLIGATTFEEKSAVVEKTLRTAIDSGSIKELRRWVDEAFRVITSDSEHVLDMDGSGLPAFGVINLACHLIGYVVTKDGRKFCVPHRPRKKMSIRACWTVRRVEVSTQVRRHWNALCESARRKFLSTRNTPAPILSLAARRLSIYPGQIAAILVASFKCSTCTKLNYPRT